MSVSKRSGGVRVCTIFRLGRRVSLWFQNKIKTYNTIFFFYRLAAILEHCNANGPHIFSNGYSDKYSKTRLKNNETRVVKSVVKSNKAKRNVIGEKLNVCPIYRLETALVSFLRTLDFRSNAFVSTNPVFSVHSTIVIGKSLQISICIKWNLYLPRSIRLNNVHIGWWRSKTMCFWIVD